MPKMFVYLMSNIAFSDRVDMASTLSRVDMTSMLYEMLG